METDIQKNTTEIAVFGGGCFWCTEAVFKMLRGVISVEPGYAGGHTEHPTYEQIETGKTGHAQVSRVEFDPMQIHFRDLMTVFFASHDPTSLNRQGADVGTQYRSAIFYTNASQKDDAQTMIAELNASSPDGKPIVTELAPLATFWPAENYHRDYFAHHKDQMYCQLVINPKLEKVQKQFADLLDKNQK